MGMSFLACYGKQHRYSSCFSNEKPSFALESYSVQAMNYLLKPVEEKRIEKILDQIVLTQTKKNLYILLKIKLEGSLMMIFFILRQVSIVFIFNVIFIKKDAIFL